MSFPDPVGPDVAGAAPGMPDLVVHGLRKTFGAPPVRALRGVDLTVRAGEFVALMGPSASGKSTLLHLVAGLDRADEGTVALVGVRTEELGDARLARLRRRHVGLVFQFFHLVEHLSTLENVALAALIAGARPAAATARARDLLDTLGLLDRAAERPGALSGGERRGRGGPAGAPSGPGPGGPTPTRPLRGALFAPAETAVVGWSPRSEPRPHPCGQQFEYVEEPGAHER